MLQDVWLFCNSAQRKRVASWSASGTEDSVNLECYFTVFLTIGPAEHILSLLKAGFLFSALE